MVQENPLMEDDFHESPRNYENKTGKKSLNREFISKFGRIYFLFSFLKSQLGYKNPSLCFW